MADESRTPRTVSRRGFIKTAGATAALAAAFETDGLPLRESAVYAQGGFDREADVVVMGYGGGGAAAAMEAGKAGAKVLVLEGGKAAGGDTSHANGLVYLGGGTADQKRVGVNDTPDNMLKYVLAQCGPHADELKIRTYCGHSLAHYDWLTRDVGVKFKFTPTSYCGSEEAYPYSAIATPAPRGHLLDGTGAAMFRGMARAGEAAGNEVVLNALVDRLIVDGAGHVVGVNAVISGKPQKIRARKAVILASGGFQFNQKMIARHLPYLVGASPYGTPADQGTGITIAQAIGAEVANMNVAAAYPSINPQKGILVGKMGQRLINEDLYGAVEGAAIVHVGGETGFLLYDQKILDDMGAAGADRRPAAKASTMKELAAALKINPEGLEGTLAFYNKGAAEGHDLMFRKQAKLVQPIQTPPFYAIDVSMGPRTMWFSMGGLETDVYSRVLDVHGQPMPGLYAAGRVAVGFFRNVYNSGMSLGDNSFFGRIAGMHAVNGRTPVRTTEFMTGR